MAVAFDLEKKIYLYLYKNSLFPRIQEISLVIIKYIIEGKKYINIRVYVTCRKEQRAVTLQTLGQINGGAWTDVLTDLRAFRTNTWT